MVGPRRGPTRRPHTKSRMGCKQCKARHLGCDERRPQCGPCAKNGKPCSFNEDPPRLKDPDSMWTGATHAAVAQWLETGVFPFPDFGLDSTPDPTAYSVDELRMICHLAAIYEACRAAGTLDLLIWVRYIPRFISLALTHKYAMDALLSFSASHIVHLWECPRVGTMAVMHSGAAFAGMRETLGSFAADNADALLGSSLLLAWQALDWPAWNDLMGGVNLILREMEPLDMTSQFRDFVGDYTVLPASASFGTGRKRKTASPIDERALAEFDLAQNHVRKFEARLKQSKQPTVLVTQLLKFMKAACKVPAYETAEEQFDRLRTMRQHLFWMPLKPLAEQGPTPDVLVMLALYYTVALLLEQVFPRLTGAYYGSLSIPSIRAIQSRLEMLNMEHNGELRAHLDALAYPLQVAQRFDTDPWDAATAADWRTPQLLLSAGPSPQLSVQRTPVFSPISAVGSLPGDDVDMAFGYSLPAWGSAPDLSMYQPACSPQPPFSVHAHSDGQASPGAFSNPEIFIGADAHDGSYGGGFSTCYSSSLGDYFVDSEVY